MGLGCTIASYRRIFLRLHCHTSSRRKVNILKSLKISQMLSNSDTNYVKETSFSFYFHRLAEMYGAKWLLALCLAAVSALTLLIPISCTAAEPDEFPWLLVTIRTLMGIAEVCCGRYHNTLLNMKIIFKTTFPSYNIVFNIFSIFVSGSNISLYACNVS